MEKHITLAGALHIGIGFLTAVISLIVFVLLTGAGIVSGEDEATFVLVIVGTAISGFLMIRAIPEIVGGFGLLKYKPWARVLILIISCLELLEIPFGTALGAYSLWVLLNNDSMELFKNKK